MIVSKYSINLEIGRKILDEYKDLWIGLILRKFVYDMASIINRDYASKLHDTQLPKPFSTEILMHSNNVIWFSIYVINNSKLSEYIDYGLKVCNKKLNNLYTLIFYDKYLIDLRRYENEIKKILESGSIRIDFKTPLIMVKLLGINKVRAYRRFPEMSYIIKSLAGYYNFYSCNEKIDKENLFRLCQETIHETIFNLKTRPVRLKNKVISGLIGYCYYKVHSQLLGKQEINELSKLLALGQIMGVGTKRTVSLGRITLSKG